MIGIGILTTPNRDVLFVEAWESFSPKDTKIVVHNDTEFKGVAYSSNRLLEQLDDCEHIFIVNDDVVPIHEDWWKAYVNHPEPFLMYQFKLPNKPSTDMREVYRDDRTVAYTHTRGAFIYLDRKILDVVGGFDERYEFGYEHADLTNRVYNAGLTSHRAMDVPNSSELLYCLDQDASIQSSVSETIRKRNLVKCRSLYNQSKKSKAYKEYRSVK